MSDRAQKKRFVFVFNNYTDETKEKLRELATNPIVDFIGWGCEVAPTTGTPHLQGVAILTVKKRFKFFHDAIPGISPQTMLGTPEQAWGYCQKEDDEAESFGSLPPPQGKRNDIHAFQSAVISMETAGDIDVDALREDHVGIFARHRRFFDDYIRIHTPPLIPMTDPLRTWQQELWTMLQFDPDDRTIIFIVDPVGNSGKTWFTKYLLSHFPKAFACRPGKIPDLAHSIPEDITHFLMDCPRSRVKFLPFSILEELKDGRVFSPKYESRVKTFSRSHVIVFSNELPHQGELSEDRYAVYTVSPDSLTRIPYEELPVKFNAEL